MFHNLFSSRAYIKLVKDIACILDCGGGGEAFFFLRMCRWFVYLELIYSHAQVTVATGNSGFCCCVLCASDVMSVNLQYKPELDVLNMKTGK